MGYAVYEDINNIPFRHGGYGVPAYCDHPSCNKKIDRGLAYRCGDPNDDKGCGLYFCGQHRGVGFCERCEKEQDPFEPKPEHPEWAKQVLTDSSWAEWRELNPEWVAKLKEAQQ